MLTSPPSLVSMCKIQKNFYSKMRLGRLINLHEYKRIMNKVYACLIYLFNFKLKTQTQMKFQGYRMILLNYKSFEDWLLKESWRTKIKIIISLCWASGCYL